MERQSPNPKMTFIFQDLFWLCSISLFLLSMVSMQSNALAAPPTSGQFTRTPHHPNAQTPKIVIHKAGPSPSWLVQVAATKQGNQTAFQLAVPTRRSTLLLLRFQRLQEVIRMLDWAVQRGWLENLDIAQLKQVNQWLSGRLAKMMGIQWSKGLWLRIRATNRRAQSIKNWPPWLPVKYKRFQQYSALLKQLEIVLEIPIEKTFWLSFGLKQLLNLAKVPYHVETLQGFSTYWLQPPLGIPAVVVVTQTKIFVRLLWPHKAIDSKVGRGVLWRFLVQPSLFQPTQGFRLGKKRLQKNFPTNTIVATYVSVQAWLKWLGSVKHEVIERFQNQFAHVQGFGLGAILTLSTLEWKTMQWLQKRKPAKFHWVLSKQEAIKPDLHTRQRETSKRKTFQSRSKFKHRRSKPPNVQRPPPRRPLPPPRNLPLRNPLWNKTTAPKKDSVGPKSNSPGQVRSVLFATLPHNPLPLYVVTWPPQNAVFVGYFSKTKGLPVPQSNEIRRLRKPRYQQPLQNDVLSKVLQLLEGYWGKQETLLNSWVGNRQLALWMLESSMFREWMLWGYLPQTHRKHVKAGNGNLGKPTSHPTSLHLQEKPDRHVHIAAFGRWGILSGKLLQSIFVKLATKQLPRPGQAPLLQFNIAEQRTPLWMTWRGNTWMLADSLPELKRILSLYVQKKRGTFFAKLPTNSLFYQLQQNNHWNVLQIKPAHLHCLLQRSTTGQLVGLITQKVTSLEMAGLRTQDNYTLELQLRWDVDKKKMNHPSCEPPASTWRHTIPTLLAPFQQSLVWQLLESLGQWMKWRENLKSSDE